MAVCVKSSAVRMSFWRQVSSTFGDRLKMETEKKTKKILLSAWPFVTIAILFSLLTRPLLSLYGTGHWAVMQTAFALQGNAKLLSTEILPDIKSEQSKQTAERIISQVKHSSDRLKKAGSQIMRAGGFCQITSLLSLVCTVLAFFSKKPWWGGLISLPFSIYAMSIFFIVM